MSSNLLSKSLKCTQFIISSRCTASVASLNFDNHRYIYQYQPVRNLLRSYIILRTCSVNLFVDNALQVNHYKLNSVNEKSGTRTRSSLRYKWLVEIPVLDFLFYAFFKVEFYDNNPEIPKFLSSKNPHLYALYVRWCVIFLLLSAQLKSVP